MIGDASGSVEIPVVLHGQAQREGQMSLLLTHGRSI